MAKPSQSVATKPDTAVANKSATAQMPDFMKGVQSRGLNQIENSDVELPRIIMLQGTHDQVNTFDEANAGEFWHSIADIPLGKTLRIVPIMIKKSVKLWAPDASGGLLAVSDDMVTWSRGGDMRHTVKIKNVKEPQIWDTGTGVHESGLLEWGSSIKDDPESPPAATLCYDVLCAMPDFPELGYAVFTISRTGLKTGKKFLGKLKIANAPNFGLIFELGSTQAGEGQQSYFEPTFRSAGFVTDEESFNQYREACEHFTSTGFEVKGDTDDPVSGAPSGRAGVSKEGEARMAGKL